MPLIRSFFFCTLGYAGYFLANVVFFCLVPLLLLLCFCLRRDMPMRRIFHGYCAFLTRAYLPFLGIYRLVEISGIDNAKGRRPAILVANHRSRIDGPMILGLFDRSAAVIKESYARLPVFSSMVRHLDFVSVNQESLDSLARAMEKARMVLAQGISLVIFPEGTRAKTGRLLPFRDMAFRLSTETGIPVIPVILHTDRPFMARRPGSIFPRIPMRFVVRCFPPCTADKDERPGKFAERIREMLEKEIRKLDNTTEWK
jgi:1-acyl-sn-glycerol-3-phosphate acyltransferase